MDEEFRRLTPKRQHCDSIAIRRQCGCFFFLWVALTDGTFQSITTHNCCQMPPIKWNNKIKTKRKTKPKKEKKHQKSPKVLSDSCRFSCFLSIISVRCNDQLTSITCTSIIQLHVFTFPNHHSVIYTQL